VKKNSRPPASSSSRSTKKPFYDATASVREKYGAPYADLIKKIEAVQ
jgi:hypothetical protein